MTITIQYSKYIFSPEFSKKLHDFSEKHSQEPLKMFKLSWKNWTTEHTSDIQEEIGKMRTLHNNEPDETILKNMYTSARFYYRKKIFKQNKKNENKQITAQENDNNNNKKPYIGLSQEFICLIDKTIQTCILQESIQKTIVKLNKKKLFYDFTMQYLNEINRELGILKNKYESYSYSFIPNEISIKIKKTFQNRIYIICNKLL